MSVGKIAISQSIFGIWTRSLVGSTRLVNPDISYMRCLVQNFSCEISCAGENGIILPISEPIFRRVYIGSKGDH